MAPVVEKGARERSLYLPPGRWIELWDRTKYDGTRNGGGTGGFRLGGLPIDGGRRITVETPIEEIPVFVRLGALVPVADYRVDTWARADPPAGVSVTTAEETAHRLHAWAFPQGRSETVLADGSVLEVKAENRRIEFARTTHAHTPHNRVELVVQAV